MGGPSLKALSLLVLGLAAQARGEVRRSKRASCQSYMHYFAFGDSYTTTSFEVAGDQPTPRNPLGNPPLGEGTLAGGPNYVGWLTTKYNSSVTLTYDFAYSGATISNSQIPSNNVAAPPFEAQVEKEFLPNYAGEHKQWTSDRAIFSVFFGINDIGLPLTIEPQYLEDMNQRIPALIDEYFNICEELYNAGARRFMFVGVPPSDRSPYITGMGSEQAQTYSDWVNMFNGHLAPAITQWTQAHAGAYSVTYDYHRFMQMVLDDPKSYGFPDATCVNADGQSCIWWNNYHPSSKFNDLLAERMQPAMNSLGFDGSQPTGGYFF